MKIPGVIGATGSAGGTGPAGAAGAVVLISDTLLGVAAASFDISAIANTYKHLRLILSVRANNASDQPIYIRFNNDSAANYAYNRHYHDTTAVDAWGSSGGDSKLYLFDAPGSGRTAGNFACAEFLIPDYASTTFRKGITMGAAIGITNVAFTVTSSGLWLSSAAINEVTVLAAVGNLEVGSRCSLYGIN